jgi:hypothetical protein
MAILVVESANACAGVSFIFRLRLYRHRVERYAGHDGGASLAWWDLVKGRRYCFRALQGNAVIREFVTRERRGFAKRLRKLVIVGDPKHVLPVAPDSARKKNGDASRPTSPSCLASDRSIRRNASQVGEQFQVTRHCHDRAALSEGRAS